MHSKGGRVATLCVLLRVLFDMGGAPGRRWNSGEEMAGDDEPLDLVRPLVDLRDLGVAVEPLDLDAANIPHAAVDLDGVRRMDDGGVAGKAFRHGAFRRRP